MQALKITYTVIALILLPFQAVRAQLPIDSLQKILDSENIPGPVYIRTAVEFCKTVVNTDHEYLITDYAKKGLQADTLKSDPGLRSELLGYLGNHYWQIGRLTDAAEQFTRMRLLGETGGEPSITAKSFNGLGTVYYLMEDYPQALEYYRNGLKLAGTDSLLVVKFYNNLANTFMAMEQMDSVLPYYDKSIAFHRHHGNHRLLSIAYANLALACDKLKDSEGVNRNIGLAIEAAFKTDDPYQIASVYQYYGDLTYEKDPKLAEENFKKALEYARKVNSYEQISDNLENLAYLADSAGNYKKASEYLWKIIELDDSLDLASRKSRIIELEADHLAALRSAEALNEARKAELKKLKEDNRQRIYMIILGGGFLATLLLLLTGVRYYRLRMKISKTKQRFFSMIAHDIRSPFSGILGLSGLLTEEAEQGGDPVQIRQSQSLQLSLNHVYYLLENLLQWSMTETGKISCNPVTHNIHPLINEVICLHDASIRQKGLNVENGLSEDLAAKFDYNMLHTVVRNLLSNAIKFSPVHGTVRFEAVRENGWVRVSLSDQGAGIKPEVIEKIFKSKKVPSTPGTHNETGTGLGLTLCRAFISAHKGKIWADSEPGKGTTIFFTLPD